MTTAELLETVRRVEVRTNRLVNDTMVGAYLSQFRGRGGVRFLAGHLIVPKGQKMNSRGRPPTVTRAITFDPAGVAPFPNNQPWVAPTAIHVGPLRGRETEFERFGNCGEFAIIKNRMDAVIPILIPSNSTGLEFNRSGLCFNPLEFEGVRNQSNHDHR
jgi:hypothetical protein